MMHLPFQVRIFQWKCIRFAVVILVFVADCFLNSARAVIRDGGIDPANLGKGDWIYSMADATNKLGGHIAIVTNEVSLMQYYKSIGVRYLIIKMGTGSTNYSGCYTSPNQITTNLCTLARANGVWIFGYTRSYGVDVAGEAALADYNFNCGADGFVFDAEAEWESYQPWIGANGPALAWQLCSTVRSRWPTKFLAHAPFPIIYLHSSFPYKEFGYWCDAVMPQIYHFSSSGIKGSASAAINWSDVNWRAWQNSLAGASSVINGQTIYWTNSIKPIVPLQDVYGETVTGVSRCNSSTTAYANEDVLEFIDYSAADPNAVTAGGYRGINFWRADLHGVQQYAYIRDGRSGDLPGVVNNIVLDDASASRVGAWTAVRTFAATTTTPTFYGAFSGAGPDTNSFGTNYWFKTAGTGLAYVQFRPRIVVDGQYEVYQWHPERPDASSGVPFLINYDGGSVIVAANQQTNSGNWSSLGRYYFAAGTNGTVRVLDNIPEPTGVAMADGLKLVFLPSVVAPAQPVELTAAPVSTSQVNLAWTDSSTNEINFIVGRSVSAGGPYTDVATLNANSTNYSVTNLASGVTYYFVVRAVNAAGATPGSAEAAGTTFSPPTVLTQPQSQTRRVGMNVTFSISATGTAPLNYQWRMAGTNIIAATNSAYTRVNVQTNDAGAYSVVVTNVAGIVTSSNALLTVTLPAPARMQSITRFDDGRVDLIFTGNAGVGYWIERTTNFLFWEPLTNILNASGTAQFMDTTATNLDRGFYRARE